MKIRMTWPELRGRAAAKSLAIQCVPHYSIFGRHFVFAVEGPVIYCADIW